MKIKNGSLFGVALALAVGCGGGDASTQDGSEMSSTSGAERPRERQDGVAITGLMGTIRRDQVEKSSEGRLGYVHIQAMNWSSFERFEQELYSVAKGKAGLLIDVRYNGGGWTTDDIDVFQPLAHVLEDLDPVDGQHAGIVELQPIDAADQGGFAGTRQPHDYKQFPLLHVKGGVLNCRDQPLASEFLRCCFGCFVP